MGRRQRHAAPMQGCLECMHATIEVLVGLDLSGMHAALVVSRHCGALRSHCDYEMQPLTCIRAQPQASISLWNFPATLLPPPLRALCLTCNDTGATVAVAVQGLIPDHMHASSATSRCPAGHAWAAWQHAGLHTLWQSCSSAHERRKRIPYPKLTQHCCLAMRPCAYTCKALSAISTACLKNDREEDPRGQTDP